MASSVKDAVSNSECEERRKSQDKQMLDIVRQLAKLTTAISGEAGNTQRPGMSALLFKLADRQKQLSEDVHEIKESVTRIESQDTVSDLTKIEIQLEAQDRRMDDIEAKQKPFPWVKVILAIMAITGSCMGLATAAFVFLSKVS